MAASAHATNVSDDWRTQAQAHIAEHRTGPLNIVVRDRKSRPVEGLHVKAELVRHDFLFGSQISPKNVNPDTEDSRRHREQYARLFNTLVHGNGQKMAPSQRLPLREGTEQIFDWARTHDFDWRGHTLVWGVLKYSPVVFQPFHEQMKAREPVDREVLMRRMEQSIIERCLLYRGKLRHWDVVNEPVSERHLFDAFGAETIQEQAALMTRWFKLAHRLDPSARLYLNEFGILVTQNEHKRERYFQLAKAMLDQGAPLHGIGFQAHTWNYQHVNSPETLNAIFDRFASLGLELCITEFDTFGAWDPPSGDGDQLRADWFEQLLVTAYAHPAVTGFMVWGIQDAYHWKDSAPFFDANWNPKPSLAHYERYVLEQWRSRGEGTTDAEGAFTFTGHYGHYVIEVTHADGTRYRVRHTHVSELDEISLIWEERRRPAPPVPAAPASAAR
ncbi:MAG: endo-1,4-beta-xylanase [Opitutales bacterium]